MTTMYWWFLVEICSQIPSIHHETVHVFQVLQDGILVPTYLTYNHLFSYKMLIDLKYQNMFSTL